MSLLNIESPRPEPKRRIAIFDLGFRPFFLLAGISAILLVMLWIYSYALNPDQPGYYSPLLWHSHEMVFAYTVAVIAGFLLTAVRNWTGLQTTHGKALAGLVVLWLAGRIVPFFATILPAWLIAGTDLAFIPVLAVMISIPILRKRQWHNLVFLFVLSALAVANLMIHLQMLGLTQTSASRGIYFAVYLIVFLIVIVGGRVIPFFTETAIAGASSRQWRIVEYGSLAGLLLLILLDLFDAAALAIIIIASLTALAHGIRLAGWYQRAIWSTPLLWILHLAYAWLVVGLILKALSAAGSIHPMLAIHAFTAGTIGSMTLGMMTRVTLGHTGRELRPGPATPWAFALITLAGFSRVFLTMVYPAAYTEFVVLSGLLWSAAFTIFVSGYASYLIHPRIDGKPG